MPLRVVVVAPHKKVTAGLAALFANDRRVRTIPVTCGLRSVVASVANKRPDVVLLRRTWRDEGRHVKHNDPTLAAVSVAEALIQKGFWVVVLDEKWRENRESVRQLFENAGASMFQGVGPQVGAGRTLTDYLLEARAYRR